jgi:hypothetical protein
MAKHSIKRVFSSILLLNKYEYKVYITLKRQTNGNYVIRLEFVDLGANDYEDLKYLSRTRTALPVSSDLLNDEYDIRSIVVVGQIKEDPPLLTWRCHWYKSLNVV